MTMSNETLLTQEPDYEKAFDEFYGTSNVSCDDTDTELDCLARADEAAAYDENRERYMSVMRQDFPKDFTDDDPFTAALLDNYKNKGDELTMVTIRELKRDNKAALKYLPENFSFDFQKHVTIMGCPL